MGRKVIKSKKIILKANAPSVALIMFPIQHSHSLFFQEK